ncbi:MAG: sensor histidine kinase [Actinomycetota bacterium]
MKTEQAQQRPFWGPHFGPPIPLPLILGAFQVIGTVFAAHRQPQAQPLDVLGYLLLLVGPAALWFRRSYPATVLGVVLVSIVAYVMLDYPKGPVFLSFIVAVFTAVMRGRRVAAWTSFGVAYAAFLFFSYYVADEAPAGAEVAGAAAWMLVIITVAEVARTRRERFMEASRTRAEETRRRDSEERLRIAQDLHDVLAHNISLINVQAGVALHLMDERPEQARTALAAIKQASNEALGELRSVLDILRKGDEQPPRSPAARLADLDDLVERTRAAGLEVTTEIEGAPRSLSTGVDQAAFRIVQESLTNVVRHAGRAHASVLLSYGERELVVQVEDDGAGRPRPDGREEQGRPRPDGQEERGTNAAAASGGGRGIAGMSERAAALGGRLEAGPRAGGGFRVRAVLPLTHDETEVTR